MPIPIEVTTYSLHKGWVNMAKNRIVNTKFWTDNFVLDELNPIEKLVYIYLITNPYTNICGIYELSLRIMAMETGIDKENLEKVIIPKFEASGKILYKNGWIAIKNFIKHQSINPSVKKGINDGLKNAPIELKNFIKGQAVTDCDRLSHPNTDLDSNTDSNSNSNLKPSTNVDGGKPKVYGDPKINKVISFLKEKLGGSPDGTIEQNRLFASHLLKKFQKDYPESPPEDLVCRLIELGLKDSFHSKNITSFKYIYYNAQKIIQSAKGQINNPKVITI